ncbi:DUF2703 domain-containing protein [Melioribacter sp. OK-6-Me]|uniref:DUF2703 domain-containing protein n=1 Tax=unclassified Melioribacter TaxID=2627329 RepID=UPI003ED9DF2D
MEKIKIEFQYFEHCPNHKTMRQNIIEAIKGIEDNIEFIEIKVEDEDTARRVSFRGSPTVLINGKDLIGMPPPDDPKLSCRFYPGGIPSSEKIRKMILG